MQDAQERQADYAQESERDRTRLAAMALARQRGGKLPAGAHPKAALRADHPPTLTPTEPRSPEPNHSIMRHWKLTLAALAGLPLGFAQATPQGLDFDVYFESSRLQQVNYDNFLSLPENREVERDRRGVRLAWGPDSNQGFLQVFNENADLTQETSTEMVGVGFGSQGTLLFNEGETDQGLVVPWKLDLAYARGDITSGPSHGSAYYLELYGDIGIGFRSHNLQATVGAVTSGFYGYMNYDTQLSDEAIDGTNGGSYFDVQYKRASSPLYAQFRWTFGDYEAGLVRLGLRF